MGSKLYFYQSNTTFYLLKHPEVIMRLSELVLIILLVPLAIAAAAAALPVALPNCPDRCGNLTVPYPFGMTRGCYLDEHFLISCNYSNNPPKPFLGNGTIEVTEISGCGGLHILQFIARACYDRSGNPVGNNRPWLSSPIFPVSSSRNKFTAVGCDTSGVIQGSLSNCATGCMSRCEDIRYIPNGTCTGIGCCQTSIPEGLSYFQVNVSSYNNHTSVWDFNPCSYAFMVEEGKFTFSLEDFRELRNVDKLPVVLDWAIGNDTCQVARQKKGIVCGQNSECYDVGMGAGYRCNCSSGYRGNPYLPNGCQDINECDDRQLNECIKKCVNEPGNFTCPCPKGYHGDGRKDGDGCIADRLLLVKLTAGVSTSAIAGLIGTSWLYWIIRKRKHMKLKEKFFQQNGGLMLQHQLSALKGSSENIRIFTSEELEKATNKYDQCRVVGRGGFGTVYRGILSDNKEIAIKKSKVVDESQIEQFINEVVVLMKINHRNVVKLLGCCLETQVPLLVYEFIPNGTLYDHIHNGTKASNINWETRLRIAAETAGVLSYLHSAASIPIIHRDIKTANILMGDDYTAKVADFGASRLVPLDQAQLSTVVQGTLGYLDPQYMLTSQLTEKSDVYSFGVVLLELLTGKKALCFSRPDEERCLAMFFLSSMEKNGLFRIIDNLIASEMNIEQLNKAADLAKRCLQLKGEDRPTMKVVAMELERLKTIKATTGDI